MLVDFDFNGPEEEVIEEKTFLDANQDFIINLIQKNERGRQGIERSEEIKFKLKQLIKKNEKSKRIAEGMDIAEETEREEAIMVI